MWHQGGCMRSSGNNVRLCAGWLIMCRAPWVSPVTCAVIAGGRPRQAGSPATGGSPAGPVALRAHHQFQDRGPGARGGPHRCHIGPVITGPVPHWCGSRAPDRTGPCPLCAFCVACESSGRPRRPGGRLARSTHRGRAGHRPGRRPVIVGRGIPSWGVSGPQTTDLFLLGQARIAVRGRRDGAVAGSTDGLSSDGPLLAAADG
jgi:hypothetical protein